MKKLVNGVKKFKSSVYKRDKARFEELATGQAPGVLFITCSDSRVVPHLCTQCDPGDLFVIRNAGNFVPPGLVSGEAATIEYAVSVLGVQDAIVCGHSDCGAVKALLSPPDATQVPSIAGWLKHGAEVVDVVARHPEWEGQEKIDKAIEANVLAQLTQLSKHHAVAAAIEAGKLRLHGWVYDIGHGEVRAFNAESGDFEKLEMGSTESSFTAEVAGSWYANWSSTEEIVA